MINDERLLIASHIKYMGSFSETEKLDYKNGFMLSPLYDKLFDRGFMTFTEDRCIVLSNWISPSNKKRIGIKEGQFVQVTIQRTRRCSRHLEKGEDCVVGRVAVFLCGLDD